MGGKKALYLIEEIIKILSAIKAILYSAKFQQVFAKIHSLILAVFFPVKLP